MSISDCSSQHIRVLTRVAPALRSETISSLLQIRTLCLSPDGSLLLSIDENGRALLIARQRRVLLHHFSFKGPVTAARFSPDGKYVAVAVGKLLQVRSSSGCLNSGFSDQPTS